jgi:hypothetical protein
VVGGVELRQHTRPLLHLALVPQQRGDLQQRTERLSGVLRAARLATCRGGHRLVDMGGPGVDLPDRHLEEACARERHELEVVVPRSTSPHQRAPCQGQPLLGSRAQLRLREIDPSAAGQI